MKFNAETQRGGAATETECSRPRLQQRAAGGRLVNNPAHSGLRMLLRPGTGALRSILCSCEEFGVLQCKGRGEAQRGISLCILCVILRSLRLCV
jgi:hypothetical protein